MRVQRSVEGGGEGSRKGGGDLGGEGERRGRERKQQDQDSHFQAHVWMVHICMVCEYVITSCSQNWRGGRELALKKFEECYVCVVAHVAIICTYNYAQHTLLLV